jgi:hypothetical protein
LLFGAVIVWRRAGQGIARQRQAIVNGLRESVTAFGEDVKDVSSRDVLELMLLTQYWCAYSTAHMISAPCSSPRLRCY